MSESALSRADLEDLALNAIKAAPGCSHVIDIVLRAEPGDKRPNWCLAGTTPPLAPAALIEASMAVEKLAEAYLMIDG